MKANFEPGVLVLDVDGVLTDGKIYYNQNGKMFKVFGADDNEALAQLGKFIEIHVVTADIRGFHITAKRVIDDMNLKLDLVSAAERPDWIENMYSNKRCIYMGDGIYDWKVFQKVDYGIAPANAYDKTLQNANFVTLRKGAEGAVTEACDHILGKFFPNTI
jgi:3-deoxy-D-manno-octulosonate 8-phosphate phosphatase (KDO 8-P phosphatase)